MKLMTEAQIGGCPDADGREQNGASMDRDPAREEVLERSRVAIAEASRLAAGFAHDLGNELAVLKLHAQLLLRHPDMTEAMRDSAEALSEHADRASHLAARAVGMARGDEPRLVPTDVVEVLEELLPVVRRIVPPGISIDAELPAKALVVPIDSGRIRQIVVDLVQNAADAMPDGGVVSLRCTEGRSPRAGVWITVVDRGTGMADAVLERAFEPYFSTRPATERAGLGLTTAARFVADHDGRIEIDTDPRRGTSVDVWIPA